MSKQLKQIYFLFIFSIFFTTSGQAISNETPDSYIKGGMLITIDQAPYTASINRADTGIALGTGVILSNKTILTAKHVVAGIAASNIEVGVKTDRSDEVIADHDASRFVYFNNNPNSLDDLVLIKLKTSIQFDLDAKPIMLAPRNNEFNHKETYLAGYGATLGNPNNFALHAGENILKRENYKSNIKCPTPAYLLQRGFYLYSNGGAVAATGDSGGPVTIDVAGNITQLVGVTTCGNDHDLHSVAASVTFPAYYDWIVLNTFSEQTANKLLGLN